MGCCSVWCCIPCVLNVYNIPPQSLVLAPLFVWFEFLFLVGYRPALYAQLQTAVNANIAAWQASTVRKPLLDEQK